MFNYLSTHKSKKYIQFAELIRNKNDINAKEGTYGFTALMFGK
jgi:hypothetical protein